MKKTFTIVLAILCVLCVFSFCGCEKTANNTESETGSKTIIGYIDECHDGALSFDEIEGKRTKRTCDGIRHYR